MTGDYWTERNRNKRIFTNSKAFVNILRTTLNIGTRIDGLQDECMGGYVIRLKLTWDVVHMFARQLNHLDHRHIRRMC